MNLVESPKLELCYSFLHNQENKEALSKLFSAKFDGATTYNVRKLKYQLEKNYTKMQKEFLEMVKLHAELDEKGDPKQAEGKPQGTFNILPDKIETWNKSIQELMEKKFSLDKVDRIHISQIINSDIKLSSNEIQTLEPLLEGMDFED